MKHSILYEADELAKKMACYFKNWSKSREIALNFALQKIGSEERINFGRFIVSYEKKCADICREMWKEFPITITGMCYKYKNEELEDLCKNFKYCKEQARREGKIKK